MYEKVRQKLWMYFKVCQKSKYLKSLESVRNLDKIDKKVW